MGTSLGILPYLNIFDVQIGKTRSLRKESLGPRFFKLLGSRFVQVITVAVKEKQFHLVNLVFYYRNLFLFSFLLCRN